MLILPIQGCNVSLIRGPAGGNVIQSYHDNGRVPVRVGVILLGRAVNSKLLSQGDALHREWTLYQQWWSISGRAKARKLRFRYFVATIPGDFVGC